MAVETIRPNANSFLSGSPTRVGGTSEWGVLADDSDATYLEVAAATVQCYFDLTTYPLAAGERIKQIRARIRAAHNNLGSGAAGNPWVEYAGYGASATSYTNTSTGQLTATPAEYVSGWFVPTSGGLNASEFAVDDQQPVVDGAEAVFTARNDWGDRKARIYELYLDLDVWQRVDMPVITCVEASAGIVTSTDEPTFKVYTPALNDGTPSFWLKEFVVFRDAVYLAPGFDPATEEDYEYKQHYSSTAPPTTVGTAETFPNPSPLLDPVPPLANTDTYRAYVKYGKINVADENLDSEWGFVEFTLDLALPTPPAISLTVEASAGRNKVTVTPAALTHDTLERVRVQRSDDGGTTWATIRDGLVLTASPSVAFDLYDYDVPRDTVVQYRARTTEGRTASGTTLTSEWATSASLANVHTDTTWLYAVPDFSYAEGDVPLRINFSLQATEKVGVFEPLGRSDAVVLTDGASPRRDMTLVIEVWNDPDLEAALMHTGTLLVKLHTGEQRYLRATGRGGEDLTVASEEIQVWTLGCVEVSSGIGVDG